MSTARATRCRVATFTSCRDRSARTVATAKQLSTDASNLVAGDTNSTFDVFLRDRQEATTTLVSVNTAGQQATGDPATSYAGTISADGNVVAFHSAATNLVPGDTNGQVDVFVRDPRGRHDDRVSRSTSGVQGNQNSVYPRVSANGRYVLFNSDTTSLVTPDTNGTSESRFVHDRVTGSTELIDFNTAGVQSACDFTLGDISADGRYVAFIASHGFSPCTGGFDVYVRDRQLGETELVSTNPDGVVGDNSAGAATSITDDGSSSVIFQSRASNLIPDDTNGTPSLDGDDVFAVTLVESAVDTTAPVVTFGTPAEGGRYAVGQAVNVDYSCQDVRSGSASVCG